MDAPRRCGSTTQRPPPIPSSSPHPLPDWQLPPGVSRGSWDYTQSRLVADDYDDYHADNTLFEFEERILREEFGAPPTRVENSQSLDAAARFPAPSGGEPPTPVGGATLASPPTIADLGCGSGRALIPLVREGWLGLAIDLSDAMLDVVRQKAEVDRLPIDCVQANLVELTPDLVPDASADHAMCLFSTLGMIRGRDNRLEALRHMRRILKPGGRLVLHVHNFWFNLRDPSGPWWALKSLARGASQSRKASLRRQSGVEDEPSYETGDKTYPYRGVPNFFLHVFRERELRRDLREANLHVRRWIPLDVGRRHALRHGWLLPSLRANGWIIVCERP